MESGAGSEFEAQFILVHPASHFEPCLENTMEESGGVLSEIEAEIEGESESRIVFIRTACCEAKLPGQDFETTSHTVENGAV